LREVRGLLDETASDIRIAAIIGRRANRPRHEGVSMAAHVLVLYNAPTDPTHFEQYYEGTHVPLVKRIPGLQTYTLSSGPVAGGDDSAPYYFVATLAFEDMAALQRGMGSPEGAAAVADVPNFATGGVSIVMYETRTV